MLYIIETTYNNMNKAETITENNKNDEITRYIAQFNDQQLKAYNLAKNHLGSSFNIYKSNGFIEWKKTNKVNNVCNITPLKN